ncbi:neutral zinc metallopeptidase [Elizabethkingia argenteiflava]|uniref:metalloprotease n=1 Tax=Elizabethkingia argenteiflava TaxID=2681556 RepID=UPI001FCE49A3|nr:metalloprotease [Elizabethkingia argenteiflava]
MKKTTITWLLLGSIVTTFTLSCHRSEQYFSSRPSEQVSGDPLLISNLEVLCNYRGTHQGYVDQSWEDSAILKSELATPEDTEFMKNELKKNAALWGMEVPILGFVEDLSDPSSTYNAISYSSGKIYYGYYMYDKAKSKSPDNIVNAMILAHEYGHQLQYEYYLPSVFEVTNRAAELEADGFAGYYLRKPQGFNKREFSDIAAAYHFAAKIGDYDIEDEDHHGTPPSKENGCSLRFFIR